MKIGVISDTHLKKPSPELLRLAGTVFKDVDMILHAGDIVSLQVLKVFQGKQVVAVRGNMDLPDSKDILNDLEIVEVNNFRIGLVHGWDSPAGLEQRIRKKFDRVDAIVYGHSHNPANHVVDGVLFFNPGSFKSDWRSKDMTVGILTLDETITGEIIVVGAD
jgi:putative phosphoesterase